MAVTALTLDAFDLKHKHKTSFKDNMYISLEFCYFVRS